MLGHLTGKRHDETRNSQGHPACKVVKDQTANTGTGLKLGKRVEKISAFPVDAISQGGWSGYEVQAGDGRIRQPFVKAVTEGARARADFHDARAAFRPGFELGCDPTRVPEKDIDHAQVLAASDGTRIVRIKVV